jgi:hypothetical protein
VSSALLGKPLIVITLYIHATRPLALPDRLATNHCSRQHVVPTWRKLDINLSVQCLFDFLHSTAVQCRDGPRGTIHVTALTKGCRFRLKSTSLQCTDDQLWSKDWDAQGHFDRRIMVGINFDIIGLQHQSFSQLIDVSRHKSYVVFLGEFSVIDTSRNNHSGACEARAAIHHERRMQATSTANVDVDREKCAWTISCRDRGYCQKVIFERVLPAIEPVQRLPPSIRLSPSTTGFFWRFGCHQD